MELDFILVHVIRMESKKGETIGSKCLAINNHAMLEVGCIIFFPWTRHVGFITRLFVTMVCH
jgi:hypothetical protein